jgi:3',5'-cyclic AMP phosphodiesterase CpdA
VPTRVLHLSDLHFGRNDRSESIEALGRLIEEVQPELVIASGDLTHRGLRSQHERASSFLRGLELPLLTIPGNHDIPYTFPKRFTQPWQEFERLWETTEPVYRSDAVVVAGLNSVRPWRHQSGRLREDQVRRAAEVFREMPESAYRIVTLHHHLLGAPWRSRKKPVAKRNRVLAGLVEAGADLILAGHIHQSTIAERREFELASPGGEHAVVVSIAPGFGQPRPNRRGEARGLHVYEIGEKALRVLTYIWREDGWGLTAVRNFPRGREALAFAQAEHPQQRMLSAQDP